MHFSIPSTQELLDENGSSYTAFNLYVNGVLHCSLRYSQLNDLNERLKQEFRQVVLPAFPPKKFFAVKGTDLEDRRIQLEKYVQDICQIQKVAFSDIFATFLSRAQQETQLEESVPVNFEIFLMNGAKIKINIQSTNKTDVILENAMAALGIDEELTYYFGLYLVKSNSEGSSMLIRQLQEFECPYLSLKTTENSSLFKIVIRKSYWDQSFDNVVWDHQIGLNLLNVQAESDVKSGWTLCNDEAKRRLSNLKAKGSKKEFVQYCQTLQNYGYIKLEPCITNFPKNDTKVEISAGDYELDFELKLSENKMKHEKFSVTRIRSWKVSSVREKTTQRTLQQSFLLCFEYLVSKGNLKWIEVKTEQAILLSMSIKSMVDELLRKRRGEKIKKPSDRQNSAEKVFFKPRDKNTEAIFNQAEIELSSANSSNIQKAKESVKKLSDKFSVSALSKSTTDDDENPLRVQQQQKAAEAFEKIGDDDL